MHRLESQHINAFPLNSQEEGVSHKPLVNKYGSLQTSQCCCLLYDLTASNWLQCVQATGIRCGGSKMWLRTYQYWWMYQMVLGHLWERKRGCNVYWFWRKRRIESDRPKFVRLPSVRGFSEYRGKAWYYNGQNILDYIITDHV